MNDYATGDTYNHESPRTPAQPVFGKLDAGKEN